MGSKRVRKSAARSDELVERMRPLLTGEPPDVIGATLGDLLAIFLVGHRADDPNEMRICREEIMAAHVAYVWSLVELYDGMFAAGDWPPGRKHH